MTSSIVINARLDGYSLMQSLRLVLPVFAVVKSPGHARHTVLSGAGW